MRTNVVCSQLLQHRLGLVAVILVWIFFYIYSEFQSESYQHGNSTLLVFNMFVFVVCMILVAFNLFKRRFSWRNDSFILLVLLSARLFLHFPYIHADMWVKAYIYSQAPNLCKTPQSEYLNGIGFKYCYSWMNYPEGRFVLISRDVELTNVGLTYNPSNWPVTLLAEIAKEKGSYRFIMQCGYKEVNKLPGNTYFIRVFCE